MLTEVSGFKANHSDAPLVTYNVDSRMNQFSRQREMNTVYNIT